MRIEKRSLSFGHDLDTDISPLQAGLDFAVAWQTEFIGRTALEKQRANAVSNRLVTIVLHDVDAVPLGNEPVYFENRIVDKTTSAAFGYRVSKPIAIADLSDPTARTDGTTVEIDIAGTRTLGNVTLSPAYDPTGQRMRQR